MNQIKIAYDCSGCNHRNYISVSPIIPAKLFGPPEHCHPEEGGEIEPDECEICGLAIPIDVAHEMAGDADRDAKEQAAEDRYERSKEREWDK